MTPRFRPQLDLLEAREVPAALSFQLPDGSIGSAQFSTPAGVEPAESWQQIELTDLTVSYDGAGYTIAPVPYAYYANGELAGVVASAYSATDQIDISFGTATYTIYGAPGYETAPIAYDATDARDTFQFTDGTVGALSYTIPWGSVDENQASQTLTPTSFNLNIAGQNFASGSASYTQQPALVFAYGDFVGVTFSLTPAPGFAYTSLTAGFDINGDNIIQAIQAGTGQQFIAAPIPQQVVKFDFANATTGEDYLIYLYFNDGSNKEIRSFTINVSKTDGVADIANKVAVAVNGTAEFKAVWAGSEVTMTPENARGRGWEKLKISLATPLGMLDPSLDGPTLREKKVVTVTGQFQNPNP